MSYPIDPRTGKFLWRCPQCKEIIRFSDVSVIRLAEQAGGCQGCRAKATFERNPRLISFFLDYWTRSNAWPQSHSWTEAIPVTA
jgi:uncharacterized C2H2 Zn-finger protein